MQKEEKSLLVVVAHPDDEVLGCGATVRLRVDQGWAAHLIVMTTGVTGRLSEFDNQDETIKSEQKSLKNQMQKVANIIGFKSIHCHDFPDNRLDTVSRMDIVHALIPQIKEFRPNLVITHHPGDYNWDHGLTFDAVMMAARVNPPEFSPSEIWTCEVLSSTERAWQNNERSFHPNLYIDVSSTIEKKKEALVCYKSEYRPYPHPRSVEAMVYLARKRGNEAGINYGEAFHLIRKVEK